MSRSESWYALASNQHGVISRPQLLEMGFSKSAIDRRIRSGALTVLHPGVYAAGGQRATREQRLMAAALSVDACAVASHRSAAALWELLQWPKVDEVSTTRSRWRPKAFLVHRTADLDPDHRTTRDGIPVTTPARTIVDLGAVVGRRTVALALDTGLRSGLVTLPDVATVVDYVGRQGRAGVGVARLLLAEREEWVGVTESVLEDLFRQVLADAGLPQPIPQMVVRDRRRGFIGRVDFGYPKHRLVIELDGYRFHSDPTSFGRDRSRQNALISAGYRVLRYTAHDLRHERGRVVAEVAHALAELGNSSVG